jgi:uncharacterized Zn-finger protein
MTPPFPTLLRHAAAPSLLILALGLTACSVEPLSFWTDRPKGELDLVDVSAPPPPVERKPQHDVGLNVTVLPGYVRTPYTHPPKLVDVRGMQPGSLVICPYTHKLFNIPADFVDMSSSSRMPTPSMPHLKQEPAASEKATKIPAAEAAASSPVMPYGKAIPGRPGFVHSPYASSHQMVDVTGLAVGMEVQCPYTGKYFRVPPPIR